MIFTDFVLTCAHFSVWVALFLANKEALGAFLVMILFSATVLYTSSPYFDYTIDAVNHGVQSIWFLAIFMRPIADYIKRVSIRVKILLVFYAMLQFAAMIDCILYGEQGIFGQQVSFFFQSFLYIQISIDVLILLALWTDRRARHHHFTFNHNNSKNGVNRYSSHIAASKSRESGA